MNRVRKGKNGRGGPREGAGRPFDSQIDKTSSQEGLQRPWTRATFIVRKDYVRKLKDLALSREERLKDVMDEILKDALVGPSGKKTTGGKKKSD